MSSSKERLSLQPLQAQSKKPRSPNKKRSSIWIRPHDVRNILVELRVLVSYYLVPPLLPKWKRVLRLGADLLGITIALTFICFQVAQGLINPSLSIDAQNAPLLIECIAMQPCDKVSVTPKAGSSHPASQVSPVAILVPLPAPTPLLVPSPIPSLTPTPSIAILSVAPTSLTVSYSHTCAIRAPILLTLKNVGGATLVWWQDKNKTSPGIRIVDPTKAYLLQPGQSVTANAYCSPGNNKGHYKLQILYNAGTITIPVAVTD